MEEVYIQTPLGITAIKGDSDGIVAVSVLKEDAVNPSQQIPDNLTDAVKQLGEYFARTRQNFQLR